MRANSDLGFMIPEVHLFHSRKKLRQHYRRRHGKKLKLFDTEGQMVYVDGEAMVLMTHVGKEPTELALLAHEAYHAAVAHMEFLGEDKAGEETMAYLVQSIAHGLFVAHLEWKRKHGRLGA